MTKRTSFALPTPACPESYPGGARRGEITDCARGPLRHWKHKSADGSLHWWGAKLTAEELAEAQRIRAMGGIDMAKIQAWLASLEPKSLPNNVDDPQTSLSDLDGSRRGKTKEE